MKNSKLYPLKYEELSEWVDGTKCQLKAGRLPLVFSEVPLRLMEVLGVTCLQVLTTQVVEADEG